MKPTYVQSEKIFNAPKNNFKNSKCMSLGHHEKTYFARFFKYLSNLYFDWFMEKK